mgnify:FL=1|tara:strand:- start:4266 stop:5537 length:1272 start_codon:yes stop_codon:yes gene_type:complete
MIAPVRTIQSKHFGLIFVLLFLSCASIPSSANYKFDQDIRQDDIYEHIKYLSSDDLEGRYPGTKGSQLAIDYISYHFKKNKILPFGDDGYLQFFDFSNFNNETITVPNVVGLIPGTSLKDEYIVIGAHFDHLGYGGPHSGSLEMNSKEIHNGADDNASGVAGILELASKLSQNQGQNKRSIVVIAFNAEEQGIFGSKYFSNNFDFENGKIVTMINLDMIGRLRNLNLNVMGTGTSPIFDKILDKAAAKHFLNISKNPEGFGPSDHSSFYVNDIPVLSFFTGAHTDYHKPNDDIEKINASGQLKVVKMIYDVITNIDDNDSPPQFTEAGPKSSKSPGMVRLKVTFGFMPSYSSAGNGLGVDGVRADGPAGKAGLKKGDVIVEINGSVVKDIYGYMTILEKLKPGESSNVKLLRDNKEKLITINH